MSHAKLKFFIPTVLLPIAVAACGSGSSCTRVTIPTITLKCSATSAPCNEGALNYSTGSTPYYVLGVYIITGSACNGTTLQAARASAVATAVLSQSATVYDTVDTYTLQTGSSTSAYLDSKGTSITQLCSGTYTVCAIYGSVNSSGITISYYQRLSGFSLSNPSTTTFGPTGWIAL